jgi:cytochrome b561
MDTDTSLVDLQRYSTPAILMHWTMALLIPVGMLLGLYMARLGFSPLKLFLYSLHKWIGVAIFAMGTVRLVWRLTHVAPAPVASMPGWQRRAAGGLHGVLYLLMLVVPLAGWLYSSASGVPTVFLGIPAFQLPDAIGRDVALASQLKALHQALAYLLASLVVLHIAAAAKHHFVNRDGVLRRMWTARAD